MEINDLLYSSTQKKKCINNGARHHGSNSPVLQKTLENVLTATIVLTSTLVVLEVTLVT